jgi:hypothetical protein
MERVNHLIELVMGKAPRELIKAAQDALTLEDRGILFGDAEYARSGAQRLADHKAMMIDRLEKGLPMSKCDKRQARQYKRERSEG